MDAVLLDTDVFSYLLKRGDPRAESYGPHVRNKTHHLDGSVHGRWTSHQGVCHEDRVHRLQASPG
jgi:hypothetical protein